MLLNMAMFGTYVECLGSMSLFSGGSSGVFQALPFKKVSIGFVHLFL